MTKTISILEIHTDGGSRGNPGPAGIGAIAKDENEKEIFTISEYIGVATNNTAEYQAVLRALEYIKENELKSEKARFVVDSELVARQITGRYKIKQPHLKDLFQKIKDLVSELRKEMILSELSFKSVPREENKEADALVNQALDSR